MEEEAWSVGREKVLGRETAYAKTLEVEEVRVIQFPLREDGKKMRVDRGLRGVVGSHQRLSS